jgi:hypothetical protein
MVALIPTITLSSTLYRLNDHYSILNLFLIRRHLGDLDSHK